MFNTAPVDVRLFSNSNAAQNISKFTLGQIPTLKSISSLSLNSRMKKLRLKFVVLIVTLLKYFWKIALASVNSAASCGVNMFVLGQAIRRVYHRIPFVKGDDPAQKGHCTF